ncbi:MAG: GtrA family protein [Lachnospiraceae bacterium]
MDVRKLYEKYKDVIPYAIFGVLTTLVNIVVYWLMAHLLGTSTMVSTIVAWIAAVLFAYVTNRKWVFHSEASSKEEIVKEVLNFFIARLATGVIDWSFMFIFVDCLKLNDVIVKFAANIVVIVMNYVASKLFVFKKKDRKINCSRLKEHFKEYGSLWAIAIIFSVAVIFCINVLPFYGSSCPDEWVHFGANVKFIIENHRLPVSGVDDLQYLSNVRDNPFGKVNGLYSYNIYPQFNYIISAIIAVILKAVFGISYELGARYSALLWGDIFLIFIYKTIRKVSKKKAIAVGLTAVVSLIPGIIYISSYVSADIHSLAISAILVYCLINLRDNYSKKNIIFFGISCGLILVAKSNYLIYIPFVAGYIFYLYFYKKQYTRKQFWKMVICSLSIGFLMSGFWYIRNFALYHDFIGQNFVIDKMSEYGKLGVEQEFSWDTIAFLIDKAQFQTLFQSFFMWFTGIGFLPEGYYLLQKLILGMVFILIIGYAWKEKDKKFIVGIGTFLMFFLTSFFLVFYNSVECDLQFQGRYLYPVIVPAICIMAYYFDRNEEKWFLMVGMVVLNILMTTKTFSMIVQTYVPYQINTRELGEVHAGASQVMKDSQTPNIGSSFFKQEFYVDEDNFKAVSVVISENIGDQVNGLLKAKIKTSDGTVIAEYDKELTEITADEEIYIPVKQVINSSKGEKYTLEIWLENIDENADVKLYCSQWAINTDNGFYVNDQKQENSLYYKTIYADEVKK